MNLSDWSSKLAQGQDEEYGTLNGICENMRAGTMPPIAYRRMHRSAKFSQTDIDAVCHWVESATSPEVKLK